jgi:anti-anti-sigma regulatory factor
VFAQRAKEAEKSGVVSIEAQPSQGLLLVRYSGHVTVKEAEEETRTAADALGHLQPGFRLLVDLTDMLSMDIACAPFIEEVMDRCQQKGVIEVVRVIPDPTRDIGMQIMSRFHYGPEVRIVTCQTLSEAMGILSGRNPGESE